MKKAAVSFFLVIAWLFAYSFSVQAQPTGKIPRIGGLDASTASGSAVLWEAFREELSKLGWIDGKNITIEYRFAEQKRERLPELAAELVRLKVDVIVATGRAPGLAAKNATTSIPIVVASFPNPVSSGLVASLARPGGNVTGLSNLSPELNSKRLEILRDVIPNLIRVGYLQQVGSPVPGGLPLKDLRAAALALKLKLEEIETDADVKALESAFKAAKQKQIDAIIISGGRTFFAERKRIVELAGKYRLAAIYPQRGYVEAGGFIFYGVSFSDLHRRAATYVNKILKGAKPADLPVEQPTKFELAINLKAAQQIGLTIPPNVLARADRVIK
jgi:putative ABC transport system substrate-binding protein